MIYRIRHDKIVNVLETFRFEGSFYVVHERMTICLVQIVASPIKSWSPSGEPVAG